MTTNGQKLVGSAQWREDGALLQHGSILVDDDQTLLASLLLQPSLAEPVDAPHSPALGTISHPISLVVTLRDVLGRAPEVAEVATAMFDAVRGLEDADATLLDSAEVIRLGDALVEKFLDDQWTWRR